MYLKGLVAHMRDTTIPSGKKIHVCHACHNDRCSNPDHLYWGTSSENALDARSNGKGTVWDFMVAKYGIDTARSMQRNNSQSRAGKGNTGKLKTPEHRAKIAKAIRLKHASKTASV